MFLKRSGKIEDLYKEDANFLKKNYTNNIFFYVVNLTVTIFINSSILDFGSQNISVKSNGAQVGR